MADALQTDSKKRYEWIQIYWERKLNLRRVHIFFFNFKRKMCKKIMLNLLFRLSTYSMYVEGSY